MTTILAYTSPATGHTFPLVAGLRALQDRGHRVRLVTDPALVDTLRAAGLEVEPLDPRILEVQVTDYQVEKDSERLAVGLGQLMARGPFEIEDLRRHVDELRPDVLLVDVNAHGALCAAEASGLPWALTQPSLLPMPGPGIPAYGLGMRPLRGPLGRLRDAVLWKVVERTFARSMLPPLNELRRSVGLPEFRSAYRPMQVPDRVITMTGAPLEYPRRTLPAHVRMVGAQTWDPPAEVPAWLDEPGDPWVLVTCSTEYQADQRLAEVAVAALADEPVRILVTLADAYDEVSLPDLPQLRVERFVPHGAVLERAAAVVCPGGMGITAKAVARGVPVVAVPFGRDQPEVARRIAEAGVGIRLPLKELSADALRAAVRAARALPAWPTEPDGTAPERFADAVEELAAERPPGDAVRPRAAAPAGRARRG
jgi:UDP:flavonoid glycosyltransferase YjiC (YdhE family)